MTETTFSFIPRAARPAKPRNSGLTEIRGPYYSAYGQRHLADLLETMGTWIDGLKYAGGSFALMPPTAVKAIKGGSRMSCASAPTPLSATLPKPRRWVST
jgi:phosphosulfolactate synthase (CoM biosynthesis protein A)